MSRRGGDETLKIFTFRQPQLLSRLSWSLVQFTLTHNVIVSRKNINCEEGAINDIEFSYQSNSKSSENSRASRARVSAFNSITFPQFSHVEWIQSSTMLLWVFNDHHSADSPPPQIQILYFKRDILSLTHLNSNKLSSVAGHVSQFRRLRFLHNFISHSLTHFIFFQWLWSKRGNDKKIVAKLYAG